MERVTEMVFPDYKGGSIVNLISSITSHFGGRTGYSKLKGMPALKKKVVLIVMDGLGYNWLCSSGNTLKPALKITSVLPSATTACIPSLIFGVPPKHHGFAGWTTYFKELGVISSALPFTQRGTCASLSHIPLFDVKPAFNRMKCKTFFLNHSQLITSYVNRQFIGVSKPLGYSTAKGFFTHIKQTTSKKCPLFLHAYWPYLDMLMHYNGTDSKEVKMHYKEFETRLISVMRKDTTYILTADHGFVDIHTIIRLEDHPKLQECLSMPLCGEVRCVYMYVRPDKVRQFEKYINKNFSSFSTLYRSKHLLNRFGLKKTHPMFNHRIGDYVLIMDKGYTLIDTIYGEKERRFKAEHGGTHPDEMYVPVCII